ncbi:hypothetical protein A7A78_03815 [Aequorivita soesokkakensis]|jgi:hypothetical protein|uniref:DUF3244 domain-containing protein n=1 Tax=Aequorivita soesokkakensis TaxID=1385699 RepID=A0A1A9LFB9_9FLAO|nr:hypothetical protein [Aequorivita soesokkakensis]OAD91616.1 hypothetical protein A7A78_03815 [Aequorivita soesokkakensis]
MKNLLVIIAILFVSLTYGQKNEASKYGDLISMEPSEVAASAILSINFLEANTLKYTISKNNEVLFTKEIEKNEGAQMMKFDLSFLEKGRYEIRFFVENNEVKKIPFKKI